jgi:hypothetical protein
MEGLYAAAYAEVINNLAGCGFSASNGDGSSTEKINCVAVEQGDHTSLRRVGKAY